MRWFKDADGKWYYGDRPFPTHTLVPVVRRGEGLAEPTGDIVVTAKGSAPTAPTASPFAAAAQKSVANVGTAKVIETEEQARRFLPPYEGESRARWLDRVGLGYLIRPGDEKRAPHVHSSIGPRPSTIADHGQSPTGGGDGLARAGTPRRTEAKAKRPPVRLPRMQRADVAKDLDALRKHAMAEARAIEDSDLRKAALAVVDAITDLALDPSGSTDDLKGAIEALDALARKQGQGTDLAHAARVSQDGRKALGVLGK